MPADFKTNCSVSHISSPRLLPSQCFIPPKQPKANRMQPKIHFLYLLGPALTVICHSNEAWQLLHKIKSTRSSWLGVPSLTTNAASWVKELTLCHSYCWKLVSSVNGECLLLLHFSSSLGKGRVNYVVRCQSAVITNIWDFICCVCLFVCFFLFLLHALKCQI